VTVPPPRRVRVTGDLFDGEVPEGAVYVGRAAPGLPASPFANPFPLRRGFPREHPLRQFLDDAVAEVAFEADFTKPCYDAIVPGTPAVAAAAYRRWLATQPALAAKARAALAGRDLACWCPLPESVGRTTATEASFSPSPTLAAGREYAWVTGGSRPRLAVTSQWSTRSPTGGATAGAASDRVRPVRAIPEPSEKLQCLNESSPSK
jgi:hypothetical protein